MNIFSKPLLLALALAMGMPMAAHAAGKTHTVMFAQGKSSAHYRGSVSGYDYDRYVFTAQQGQTLNISTEGSNIHILAVVNYLGQGDGSMLSTQDQVLPYSGQYEVRVMQTRNGARQGKQVRPYMLNIAITGDRHNAQSAPVSATHNSAVKQTEVRFKPGTNAAVYTGRIRGYDYDSYRVRARQGQTLWVDSQGSSNYIVTTVRQVDEHGQLTALPEGVMLPSSKQVLPRDGVYDIQIMQMRAGARKGNQARTYRVKIQID